MIRLFSANPFHVLGVRATTDQRALRRILEERAVQLQLGLRAQGLTEDTLRVFRQALEKPEERVVAEVFGLHAIDPGMPSEQLPLLRDRAQSVVGLDKALLTHDVAVTAHMLWALSDPDSANGAESLRISLAAWRNVLREKDFWDYLAARSYGAKDPEALWQLCVRGLVGSVAEASGALLEQGRLAPTIGLLQALREAALPGDSIEAAVRDITRETRAGIKAAVLRIASRAQGNVNDVKHDEIELINDVLGPSRRLVQLGVQFDSEDAASTAREVSVRVFNRTKDPFVTVALVDAGLALVSAPLLVSSLASDRATVLRLHHQARAIAASQAQQWPAAAAHATLAADVSEGEEAQTLRAFAARASASSSEPIVAAWIARAQLPFEAESKSTALRIEAAAAFRKWAGADRTYADPAANDVAPGVAAPPATPIPSGRISRRDWIAGGIIALAVLLVWANGSFAGTSAPSTSGSTTRPVTPGAAAPACVAQLGAMKKAIESAQAQLTSMKFDLGSLDTRFKSLERDIFMTESTYPRGIPSSIYPTYSNQVDQRNALARQYNAKLADYNSLFDSTNADIDTYNSRRLTCR